MFGSDRMVWPGPIDAAADAVRHALFPTAARKRAIFYDSAARFLRLALEEIAHHRRLDGSRAAPASARAARP